MRKKNTSKIVCIAALVAAGFMGCFASTEIQLIVPHLGQVSSGSCPGTYYAIAKMTNSSGAFWLTPPPGTQTGTFTNASGLSFSYSLAVTRRSDDTSWCTNNNHTLTF